MKQCKSCKITFDDGQVYCSQCGALLETIPADVEKPSRSHKGVVAVAIAAVVAVAMVAIVATVFLSPKTDGVPITLAVSISGQKNVTDVPLVVHFEGTTKDGKPESRDLVFAKGEQPRIPEGVYKACPVASPILADGTIYAVPEAVEIAVSANAQEAQQQTQSTIEFTRKLSGAEITDDAIDASLKMASDAGVAQANVDELKTAAVESRAAGVPGNTSGNTVNGGRVVETEDGTYFVSNGYHVKLAEGKGHEDHGAIYRTSDGESYEKVYSRDEHISNLNHCGDRFYFTSWRTEAGSEPTSSLMSISDDFNTETLKTYYTTPSYALGSVNATTKCAYFIERVSNSRAVMSVDYASGEAKQIYSAEAIAALSLYGSHLYFLVGNDAAAGCSRIVCTDTDGKNETTVYSSDKSLSDLNIGQEGLTFVESDNKSNLSTIRRIQFDGSNSGLGFEMPYTYVNGLNMYRGSLYCLTTESRANSGPTEQGILRLIDLENDSESTVTLDGVSDTDLGISANHAFYSRGFDVDDEINPPAALPDPANMKSREYPQSSTTESEIEAAYARNPSGAQNIDEKTHNLSEYAELTGVVHEYEGHYVSGTPVTVYTLDLPSSFTVYGTKYGDVTGDKIVLPDSPFSEYVGKAITIGAQYSIRVSEGAPEHDISKVYVSQPDGVQPTIIRLFD